MRKVHMDSNRPAWQRRLENGAIGEARTKAFLLDRFWILERSIDIEGADLIIQRRLTHRSLLDQKAPRLAYVQAKYFQDRRTTQSVHREFVEDSQGNSHGEFFLICHTGSDDDSEMFILAAQEIQANFAVGNPDSDKQGCYMLPGRDVLASKWKVTNKKRSLDQLEEALVNADFASNRSFLLSILPDEPSFSILPEFAEDIDSWQGGVSGEFFKLRKKATEKGWWLVQQLDLLQGIANTDDVVVAAEKACEYVHLLGRDDDGIYDKYFHMAALNEREWYKSLQSDGLVGAYAKLKSCLRASIIEDSVSKFPFVPSEVYLVDFTFDIDCLEMQSLAMRVVDSQTISIQAKHYGTDCEDIIGVQSMPAGSVQGFIFWARFFHPEELSNEGYDPRNTITNWVDELLRYMMWDVLDEWQYDHRKQEH